jgi:MraZ protein
MDRDHLYYAMAWRLELDKLGRVRVPEVMLRNFKIQREVTVSGAGDHIEIWNKADFRVFLEKNLPRDT